MIFSLSLYCLIFVFHLIECFCLCQQFGLSFQLNIGTYLFFVCFVCFLFLLSIQNGINYCGHSHSRAQQIVCFYLFFIKFIFIIKKKRFFYVFYYHVCLKKKRKLKRKQNQNHHISFSLIL